MSKEQVIEIKFDRDPDIRERGYKDDDPDEIKKQKIKYPFEIFNTVTLTVLTDYRKFSFDIYNGYYWNGADIPQALWLIVGSRYNPEFREASMIHDFMLQFKKYMIHEVLEDQITVSEYRRLTSLIFREKLKKQGVKEVKANIMSWCVDVYQLCCNRKGWQANDT